MQQTELENRFTYHATNAIIMPRFNAIREVARDVAQTINRLCPDSREKSLAFTALEEAVMWANAAIARNQDRLVLEESK